MRIVAAVGVFLLLVAPIDAIAATKVIKFGKLVDGTGQVVAFSSREPIDAADLDHDDDLFVDVLPGSAGAGQAPCAPGPGR